MGGLCSEAVRRRSSLKAQLRALERIAVGSRSIYRPIGAASVAVALSACASKQGSLPIPIVAPAQVVSQRTCLVLSVAGLRGPAHFGAIEAVKAAGIKVDCVVGTSFGAVAGSMFVTSPGENVAERYLRFVDQYVEQTKQDKGDGAAGGALIAGALGGLLTGGAGLLLGAALGGTAGADNVNERDRQRFVSVLNNFYGGANIEGSRVPFATLFQQPVGTGLQMVTATRGNLATAVGNSAANPFIFEDVNCRSGQPLDPGADRVAAVPVEDACRLAPGSRLVAINLTDQPAFFSASMKCPLLEIPIRLPPGTPKNIVRGPEFYAFAAAGFVITQRALATAK